MEYQRDPTQSPSSARDGFPHGFACSTCTKVFGRQEHLRRHERSHRDDREFVCSHCSKAFHRKDALNKHEYTHSLQQVGPSLLQRGARACSACASVKSRCTGELPSCGRCDAKRLQCVYPAARGSRRRTAAADVTATTTGILPPQGSSSVSPEDHYPQADPPERRSSPDRGHQSSHQSQYDSRVNDQLLFAGNSGQREQVRADADLIPRHQQQNEQQRPLYNQNSVALQSPFEDNAIPTAAPAMDWSSNALASTINWLQPETLTFSMDDFDGSMFPVLPIVEDDNIFPLGVDFLSPDAQQLGFQSSPEVQIPHLGHARPAQIDLPTPYSFNSNEQLNSPIAEAFAATPTTTAASDKSPADNIGEYYVNGQSGRLPKSKRRKTAPFPKASRVVHDSNRAERAFSLEYKFPLIPCLQDRFRLPDRMYRQLQDLHLRLCLETTMFKVYMPPSPDRFPTKPALEGLLSSYFAQFAQIMPFLHPHSFNAESRHLVLLLAMMALGSCFLDGENAEIFALSMHEFLRRVLILMDEDNSNDWLPEDPETLAQIHLLHAVGGGYTLYGPLRASAFRSLCTASNFCRDRWSRQGLRRAELIMFPKLGEDDEGGDPSAMWENWIKKEESTRIGFCIWLLDCMYAFHQQQPPQLRLDDAMTRRLPCADGLWAAETASGWRRISKAAAITGDKSQDSTPQGPEPMPPTLLEAVQSLYMDKRLLPGLGQFSHVLLIHSLFHRTWEVETTVTQSLSPFEPSAQRQANRSNISEVPRSPRPSPQVWAPSAPLYDRWRNAACDCLDILHWNANAMIGAASGMEHPTVLHLHFARVVLLVPMNNILLFCHHLVRSSSSSSNERSSGSRSQRPLGLFPIVSAEEADQHRRLIQRWAMRDQYKARLAAIHAGVSLWHVRLYSINAFYEPVAVALATLTLWALSVFGNNKKKPTSTSSLSSTSHADRDIVGSPPSPDVCDIILIDRPTDDELVQQFVIHGEGMRANMTGVGDIFGPQGPRRLLAQGKKLLQSLENWPGVTNYWLEVLGRLEKVTAMAGVNVENPPPLDPTANASTG